MSAENVDTVNAVIRGVSVITSGITARGHDLQVDETTIDQMLQCARDKGQISVKVDHRSGAAAVCGFLTNFRREGRKLAADWHLLKSHPQAEVIIETALKMPGCVGLSAAFIAPDPNPTPNKARCKELISVDYVTSPAANPDGIFSATINGTLIEFSAAGATLRGLGRAAKIGIANGLIGAGRRVQRTSFTLPSLARPVTRRAILDAAKQGFTQNKSQIKSVAGGFLRDVGVAGLGAIAVSEIQRQQRAIEDRRAADRRARRQLRELSAKLDLALFSRRDPPLDRVISATEDNLPRPELPYKEQAGLAKRVWHSDTARAARLRALRIGVLAGGGGLAAHRYLKPPGSWKVGAGLGAAAGILFTRESHSPESLAKRLGVSRDKVHELTAAGALTTHDFGHPGGLLAFDTGELNAIQLATPWGDGPPPWEKPSTLGKIAKGAAIGAGALAGASLLRGRAGLGSARAGQVGPIGTGIFGARRFAGDAADLLRRGQARLAGAVH
jgi:hypothetical protein